MCRAVLPASLLTGRAGSRQRAHTWRACPTAHTCPTADVCLSAHACCFAPGTHAPPQEIDALFKGVKQNCVVYFLDETFEELAYDASTTVMEAVEALAGQIKLENYQTFSLFAVHKVGRLVAAGARGRCHAAGSWGLSPRSTAASRHTTRAGVQPSCRRLCAPCARPSCLITSFCCSQRVPQSRACLPTMSTR